MSERDEKNMADAFGRACTCEHRARKHGSFGCSDGRDIGEHGFAIYPCPCLWTGLVEDDGVRFRAEVTTLLKQLAEAKRLSEVGARAEKGECLYGGAGCGAESPLEPPCFVCSAGELARHATEAETALAAAQAREAKLREEIEQIELQVSSNEGEPESVLGNIGRMARAALAASADDSALVEVVGRTLRQHWLAGIDCDEIAKTDRARCACSKVELPICASVGEAVDTWIQHVASLLGLSGGGA